MAKNIVFEDGDQFAVPVPAGTKAGDPVVFGQLPGVALVDRDADGNATCKFNGVADLPVAGDGAAGAAAVTAGGLVYLDGGVVNVDATNGVRFGYALAAVASGATTTIRVKIGY